MKSSRSFKCRHNFNNFESNTGRSYKKKTWMFYQFLSDGSQCAGSGWAALSVPITHLAGHWRGPQLIQTSQQQAISPGLACRVERGRESVCWCWLENQDSNDARWQWEGKLLTEVQEVDLQLYSMHIDTPPMVWRAVAGSGGLYRGDPWRVLRCCWLGQWLADISIQELSREASEEKL